MNNKTITLLLAIAILGTAILSCSKPSQPDVPLSTYPPQENQPLTAPEPDTQTVPAPNNEPDKDAIVRNIVVDEHNNIFPIGIPAGQQEQTEISADNPVDYWFEYLPAEAKLEIDGKEIQRDPIHWEFKIAHTQSVTKFSYCIHNTTGGDIAYNLHLVPSLSSDSVPVIVRQRWIAE